MSKTKVLLIVEAMGGGVRRHIIDLLDYIDYEKFDVALLYGGSRADSIFISSKERLSQKAQIIESKYLQREISPKAERLAYGEIKKVIGAFKPDIVHCHSSKAGILGRLAAKRAKVGKIFYTPHAYSFQAPEFSGVKNIIFTKLEKYFSRRYTTKTFNVSAGERDCALERKIDAQDKFTVIYNGLPDVRVPGKEAMRAQLNIPQDAFVAGVTARLNEQKDPLTFAKIAQKVTAKHKNAHFVYIGDGPLYDSVLAFVQENSLEENVHLLGFRDDADMVVSAFDVYLLTSLYEGLPYSPIESMRADVPIVATKATGNTELVTDGENGMLFEIGNADQAASIIMRFINGEINLRGNARKTFEERFLVDVMVRAIEKEYLL